MSQNKKSGRQFVGQSIDAQTLRASSRESRQLSSRHLKEYGSQFTNEKMKLRIKALTSVSPHFKNYLPNNQTQLPQTTKASQKLTLDRVFQQRPDIAQMKQTQDASGDEGAEAERVLSAGDSRIDEQPTTRKKRIRKVFSNRPSTRNDDQTL